MSRPIVPKLPVRDGVSPSAVAVTPGAWSTVVEFLSQRLPALSEADWARRCEDGLVVMATGQALQPTDPVEPLWRRHERIYYWRSLPHEPRVPHEAQVLFQDSHIVVADKPHFLPVVPTGRYVQETLLVRLRKQLGLDTLTPMHRLDRETAGLVLFSIRPTERNAYQTLFRDRQVHKIYQAVAPWRPDLSFPKVVENRLQDGHHFMTVVSAPGQPNARTAIDLLEHDRDKGLGLYELRPSTGQRHQLRVHLSELGLPILHDRIYPTLLPQDECLSGFDVQEALQLLACTLAFTDPITGEHREFNSQRSLNWPWSGPGL